MGTAINPGVKKSFVPGNAQKRKKEKERKEIKIEERGNTTFT
jgi:hypothetical protein